MEIGSKVTLEYVGKLEDGTVFGKASADDPLIFQTGMEMVIDGFEAAVLEMSEVGQQKSFKLDQYEAYGEYIEDHKVTVPREQIPVPDLKVGQRVWMSNDEIEGGTIPSTVLEINEGDVVFDLNHPLSGKTLYYEIKLLDVEDAPEGFIPLKDRVTEDQNYSFGK